LAENPFLWDITASNNDDADPAVPWPEGMLPGAVNNSARAIMAGVARFIKDLNGTITTSGFARTPTGLTSSSAHTTLTNGIVVTAKASFSNTAAATLDLNSFGAKKIRTFVNGAEADLGAGQIISGCSYQFKYDTALDSAPARSSSSIRAPIRRSSPRPGRSSSGLPTRWKVGWLWCNGYPALFTAIGTTYGAGDGSTTFNLPNYKGRSPFGSGDMGGTADAALITSAISGFDGTTLGATGGVESITLSTAQIPSHSHTGTVASGGSHTHTGTTDSSGAHSHSGSADSQGAHDHGGSAGSESSHTHSVSVAEGVLVLDSTGSLGVTTSAGSSVKFNTSRTSGAGSSHNHSITSGGAHTHTITTDTFAAHTHTFTTDSGGAHSHGFTGDATGGGGAHRNMPPAIIQNFVIKA
jgi:microcystin-dependent protein